MKNSEKKIQLTKIAKMYYYGHMTQQQISEALNISRSNIARKLIEAEKLGIVKVTINDPYFNQSEASNAIKEALGLEFVYIVPSAGTIAETKKNIGIATSKFLNKQLTKPMVIGVSWGTTVSAFVNNFKAVKPSPGSTVIQLIGGTYIQSLHLDGRELAQALASKLKCNCSILQAPLYVHNPELKDLLLKEPETQNHFDLIGKLDIAFIGIGSSNYKESVMYKAHFVEEDVVKELYSTGICDVCGHQIDDSGNETETYFSSRHIGISLNELKNTPMVVGICAGRDKTKSILSASKGNYLKGLIIDEIAAISVLEALHLN